MKNSTPKSKKKLIRLLTDICCYAQRFNDYYFENPEDCEDVDIEYVMQTTSHIVACYLSHFFDIGVESEIVIDELCERMLTKDEWKDAINKIIKDMIEWSSPEKG